MSFDTTTSLRYCLRSNSSGSVATDDQPLQMVELRFGHSSQMVFIPSHQVFHQTSPTLLSDTLIPFSVRELQDPPFVSHYFLLRFFTSFNICPTVCETLFHKITSFALQLSAGNHNVNFHIIVAVDLVYTLWVDLDPTLLVPQDSSSMRKGAATSVMERLMEEKFDGNGGEEMGDKCSVCYDDFDGETELSKIPCGHVYHKSCILKWLNINNSCPLCRKELEE